MSSGRWTVYDRLTNKTPVAFLEGHGFDSALEGLTTAARDHPALHRRRTLCVACGCLSGFHGG